MSFLTSLSILQALPYIYLLALFQVHFKCLLLFIIVVAFDRIIDHYYRKEMRTRPWNTQHTDKMAWQSMPLTPGQEEVDPTVYWPSSLAKVWVPDSVKIQSWKNKMESNRRKQTSASGLYMWMLRKRDHTVTSEHKQSRRQTTSRESIRDRIINGLGLNCSKLSTSK